MNPEDIAFIVPARENMHVLYLKDGRIITIGTIDGKAYAVAHLPTPEQLASFQSAPRVSVSQVLT
jgi:hypothetical protein